MPLGMAAGTAMGGMDTIITMVTTTHMTIRMVIPTIRGMPTYTAMLLRPPQPRPVGAPFRSPW